MDAQNVKRCSFTLPKDLAGMLDRVAKRLGMSQSALVALLLGEPIADIDKLLSLIPADIAPEQAARRMRGASADLLRDRVADMMDRARQSGLDLAIDLDAGKAPPGKGV
jgi:hypothetical protein